MVNSYMTGSSLLESLRGQQYVVLRPVGSVAAFYEREQSDALKRLPEATPHPNTGHVTLRGFVEPERVQSLREEIASWAHLTSPIELTVDAVDAFPPPFQVLIARLERTNSLLAAYAGLTEMLDATDFRRVGELPLDDWVFHLSLAYLSSLDEQLFGEISQASSRTIPSRPSELISTVDLVSYDQDGEHVDSFALKRP